MVKYFLCFLIVIVVGVAQAYFAFAASSHDKTVALLTFSVSFLLLAVVLLGKIIQKSKPPLSNAED